MKLLSSIFGLSGQCLFTSFLKCLNVRHNKGFSDAYFYQHPYNGNLFGFSSMLQDYGVENVGLKLNDKEEITALQTPFIAQITDDFVIVSGVASGQVDYIWRGERIRSALTSFFETWTGVVLIAETDKDSGEPDFKKHYKEELFGRIRHYALGAVVLMFALLAYIGNGTYLNLEFTLLLLANLGGMYISLLLVLKQMDIHSEYADKLCSLFNKNGCNNILETEAAKFMGVISWSEAGLSYFLANSFILLFVPQFVEHLLFFNLCALPYSFWSVWYQKFRAKQWCMLCLLVQALLWCIAAIGFIWTGGIHIPLLVAVDVLLAGSIYIFAYLGISLLLPAFTKAKQQEREVQQMNSLKMKERVFSALLKEQPHYEVDKSTSQIVFGNPDAGLLIPFFLIPIVIRAPRCTNGSENY